MDLELPYPLSGDETASKWTTLAPFLTTTSLPQLRSLDIWLDHNDLTSWTLVSERILLHALPTDPSIPTTVNLPYLHPAHESATRHFTPTSASPAFTLNRRVRQRFFAESISGKLGVLYEPDFPLLLEQYEDMGMEVEEIAATEREMWESGRDVEAEVRILSGMRIQYNNASDSGSEIDLDNLSSDSDNDEGDNEDGDNLGAGDGEIEN
jgi:hypothetical protein